MISEFQKTSFAQQTFCALRNVIQRTFQHIWYYKITHSPLLYRSVSVYLRLVGMGLHHIQVFIFFPFVAFSTASMIPPFVISQMQCTTRVHWKNWYPVQQLKEGLPTVQFLIAYNTRQMMIIAGGEHELCCRRHAKREGGVYAPPYALCVCKSCPECSVHVLCLCRKA